MRFNSEVSGIKFCFFCGCELWALKWREQKRMRSLWNTFAPYVGECCVMWSCMICTAHQILSSWSNQAEWPGRGMWHTLWKKIRRFRDSGNLKERIVWRSKHLCEFINQKILKLEWGDVEWIYPCLNTDTWLAAVNRSMKVQGKVLANWGNQSFCSTELTIWFHSAAKYWKTTNYTLSACFFMDVEIKLPP